LVSGKGRSYTDGDAARLVESMEWMFAEARGKGCFPQFSCLREWLDATKAPSEKRVDLRDAHARLEKVCATLSGSCAGKR